MPETGAGEPGGGTPADEAVAVMFPALVLAVLVTAIAAAGALEDGSADAPQWQRTLVWMCRAYASVIALLGVWYVGLTVIDRCVTTVPPPGDESGTAARAALDGADAGAGGLASEGRPIAREEEPQHVS